MDAEQRRLDEDVARTRNWKRWGPYLSERQWGTVREDYSENGDSWNNFPHDHARSRAYRWGEDGLLGFCDREGRLNLALGLWNERDGLIKERLYGLTGPQGNHGEDVKEVYAYLDSSPTHSYARAAYHYPQAEFPYAQLVAENASRDRGAREFEIEDTGVFADGRWFEVIAEYAKASPDDLLLRVRITNRGPEAAPLHVLGQLWFRNTWSWGRTGESYPERPSLERAGASEIRTDHATLGRFRFFADQGPGSRAPQMLFTENETNAQALFGSPNASPYVKDAFHRRLIEGDRSAVHPEERGTKAAAWHSLHLAPGETQELRFRLTPEAEVSGDPFGPGFDEVFADRLRETDLHYERHIPLSLDAEERRVAREGYAGLLWSKQFYFYVVKEWLEGDPAQPQPPESRRSGRNREWSHLHARDVLSMPDAWEYPWFAAWDLAFHMLPFARIDVDFAKHQLQLFLREWYMHPNGQAPAYEWHLGDVNPPVHAWAAWRVYKHTGVKGKRDRLFLRRIFQKLLLDFTWWVNRKDLEGNNLFAGGFLGLDNIGVFDRSKPLPGGRLEQADGTAWMAFYCGTMLSIALELAAEDPAYEDLASKFFEHFISIADAMNHMGGTGLWDEESGFYHDRLHLDGHTQPLQLRSVVGLLPLIAVEVLEQDVIDRLPGFKKRMQWFIDNRQDLSQHIAYLDARQNGKAHRLLAIPSRERLERVLRVMLDENEFLSPHGIRSMSRAHLEHPFEFVLGDQTHSVRYTPGESDNGLFGGNSNWRGPVWFPVNYLLIEALERYHHFYGDTLKVECPTGSGQWMDLREVSNELSRRLVQLFVPGKDGRRPFQSYEALAGHPASADLLQFHEYFDGDTGRGCGASHQTGWTALVTRCLEKLAESRDRAA